MGRLALRSPQLIAVALLALAAALVVVALGAAPRAAANFPGQNGVIAFVDHDQSGSINTIPPHGGAIKTLVEGSDIRPPGTGDADVAWPEYSPSGKQIVFSGGWSSASGPFEYHLFRMGATGGGV